MAYRRTSRTSNKPLLAVSRSGQTSGEESRHYARLEMMSIRLASSSMEAATVDALCKVW